MEEDLSSYKAGCGILGTLLVIALGGCMALGFWVESRGKTIDSHWWKMNQAESQIENLQEMNVSQKGLADKYFNSYMGCLSAD
jgi:hypothetical protein